MRLVDYQMALGRCLRASGAEAKMPLMPDELHGLAIKSEEAAQLLDLVCSRGFDFTRRVQRSWSRARAASAAALTLSSLPLAQRSQLVNDWVEAGGSSAFDPTVEAIAFLDFIESRLSDPSHALTICRTERAIYRASEAATWFKEPHWFLDDSDAVLRAGSGADLVHVFAAPERLFSAIEAKAPLPPMENRAVPLLFAPGLTGLVRTASSEEAVLWGQLSQPITTGALWRCGHSVETIAGLFLIGAIELDIAGDCKSNSYRRDEPTPRTRPAIEQRAGLSSKG